MFVEVDDPAVGATQVLGFDGVVDTDLVADAQRRQRVGGLDGVQQMEAGVGRVGDEVR